MRHHGGRYWPFRSRCVDGRCGLVVGCVLCKNTWGFVPGNWRYPSDVVSIIVGIGAIGKAASTPNWSLCHIVRATTSLGNDAWRRRRQNWRNKTARLVFLHNGTLRIIDHGSPPCPMATMRPHFQLLSIQQSANILWNRSKLLKLEKSCTKALCIDNCRACLLLGLIIVPLMQSIGSNNDSAYMLYMFSLTPCALGLACRPCLGPWQLKFGEYYLALKDFRGLGASILYLRLLTCFLDAVLCNQLWWDYVLGC
jgi:hypothetical protein